MGVKLTQSAGHAESAAWLDQFYAKKLIPAEKKPFLIDLQRSAGPFLAVDASTVLLDAASQIASMAIGFNASPLFGAAQFLESWTGRTDTAEILAVRAAYCDLLARLSGWRDLNVHFGASGADAIEIGLGHCWAQRTNHDARRVLAFEGAFHGRMMVALAATWSRAKREPFAWPGYENSFVPYPEMDGDVVTEPTFPDQWQELWSLAPRGDFDSLLADVQRLSEQDGLLRREVESLLSVRENLLSGNFYAVLIEPMQCEGGDRYSSARFHHALVNLCRAFSVPLVYDEIQTGFGLGGDFFWHHKFALTDHRGRRADPDVVILAKKAQVGAVLTHGPIADEESYCAASLVRGYIQASMLDQFRGKIVEIEDTVRQQLQPLVQDFSAHITRPRVCGLCFAFDFYDPQALNAFIGRRFDHGLLYYPAGKRTARFRMNLAYRSDSCTQLWSALRSALADTFGEPGVTTGRRSTLPDVQGNFAFHERFALNKLETMRGEEDASSQSVEEFIRQSLIQSGLKTSELQVTLLDATTYPAFRGAIQEMQTQVYEPLRQTALEKFDRLIEAAGQVSIVVTIQGEIVAMAFAAPQENFPQERGLISDRYFEDEKTVYMLDLTVARAYRGKLGRIMKQAVCLLAQQRGHVRVQGRNRDRLARSMWAINLSLGSYGTAVLKDDYLDDQPHRDCLMYRCPLTWTVPRINLSNGIRNPLDASQLDRTFLRNNLAGVVNKLTLSNFVTKEFLTQLADVFQLLPVTLQHGYTASGISECVDKLIKSLWLKRRPRTQLVTIAGSYFGSGSFMARSLSGHGEALFSVTQVSLPGPDESEDAAKQLEQALSDAVLAVFVEPLGWKSGRRLSEETLTALVATCRRRSIPIVFHDSAGLFHRYAEQGFLPSAMPGLTPDAGMIFLGGQMALAYMSEEYFVADPLAMISTWDGDIYSLSQFHRALQLMRDDTSAYLQLMRRFGEKLDESLSRQHVVESSMQRGVGWFKGALGSDLAEMFDRDENGRCVSCPSHGQMKRFLQAD